MSLRQAAQQALAYIEEVDYGPYDKQPVVTALRAALAEPEQYAAQNPLGGPAKVFDAMADAIRAGDDYHATLRRYGFAEVKALAEPEQEPVRLQCTTCGTVYADGVPPQVPDYERGFVDGMSEQAKRSVDKAVNRMADPEQKGWFTIPEVNEWAAKLPQTTHWEGCEAVHPECRKPEQPVAIKWALNGDKRCGYDNWLGETPFGRILITWKSWKEFPEASVDEFPGGFNAYGDPEKVKVECEAEFRRRIGIAPTPRKPLTEGEMPTLFVGGLALNSEATTEIVRAIERAHGIGEQHD